LHPFAVKVRPFFSRPTFSQEMAMISVCLDFKNDVGQVGPPFASQFDGSVRSWVKEARAFPA
jgi:hypothetical protein